MKNPLKEKKDLFEEVQNGRFEDREKEIQIGRRTYAKLSVSHKPNVSWRKEWVVCAEITRVKNEKNSRLSEGYTETREFDEKKRAQKYFDYLVEKHTD